MLKRITTGAALVALAVFGTLSAHAQTAVVGGYGPRVGFSSNPDQIVFGGQLIIGELAPDLTFDPNLELGFGDDVQVVSFNLDLHYHFAIQGSPWRPYAGAGASINFIEVDVPPPFEDISDTEVGGTVLVGAGVPTSAGNRFFGELKFGLGDVPDLKLIVGWNFKI